jgi:hypothetical protein
MTQLMQNFVSVKCIVSFSQRRPTQRAADGGDSAAFSGFFHAQAESCSRSFISARPTAANANRWAAQPYHIYSRLEVVYAPSHC